MNGIVEVLKVAPTTSYFSIRHVSNLNLAFPFMPQTKKSEWWLLNRQVNEKWERAVDSCANGYPVTARNSNRN